MSTEARRHKTPILFVSYKEQKCGVYQWGKNILEAISKSEKYQFHYAAVSNLEELDAAVANSDCEAILYNYHPQTLTFIHPSMERRYKQVNIAVMHEMTQA